MKYRKKPVVVEAFQMTDAHRKSEEEWPQWLIDAWHIPMEQPGAFYFVANACCLSTLEGQMVVSVDDWIIRGVKGELYPCKPDIFEATYELEEAEMVAEERRKFYEEETTLLYAELARVREALEVCHVEIERAVFELGPALERARAALPPAAPKEGE